MSIIAIKGHTKRGKEVIEILEILGGKNVYDLSGDTSCAYYVIEKGEIRCGTYIYGNEPYTFFTLEEFENKYPYKVWDKVICDEEFVGKIVGMSWDDDVDEIYYSIIYHDEIFKYSVDLLQPHKEKPKELLIEFTKDSDGNLVLNNHKDYEIKEVGGKFKLIRKQPKYPKTYKECCDVLGINTMGNDAQGYKGYLIIRFQELVIARDAYWKIAGKEMGLDKPWEPDWKNNLQHKHYISTKWDEIKTNFNSTTNKVLAFPTAEMRDAFYENFKELIEQCKELL